MKKWSNTFKKNNIIYRNAAVSVYLANTVTPARVYDANNRLYYTAPQGYTDIDGYIEFYFDPSEYPTGQLFDITCIPNGICDIDKAIRYSSLLIFTTNWSGVADDDAHKPEDNADRTDTSNFVTVTYPADQSNIQTQIDGKIVSWFQSADPSGSWQGTDASHEGDMWWNTDTNKLKRWLGSAWSDDIEDQEAIDAYANAATAQDTADSKRRVFTDTPTTPYDVGDIWAEGPSGDIRRCITARASGDYQADDWELASEYDKTSTHVAAGINGQGDLATKNEADANVLNMANAPAEANADVTGNHSADIDALQTQNAPAEAGADVTPPVPKLEQVSTVASTIQGKADDDAALTSLALGDAYNALVANDSNLTVDKAASIFNASFFPASKAAKIYNNTNLTLSKAQDIINSSNLSDAKRNAIQLLITRISHISSVGNHLITVRAACSGCGTQHAGLITGGDNSSSYLKSTEEYDGTNWTSGGDTSDYRDFSAGGGTQSAGIVTGGGFGSTYLASTEEYDGTSWSAGGDLSTGRRNLGGFGTQNAALATGGGSSTDDYLASTEEYDGTSWSAGGDLSTAKRFLDGDGTITAGLLPGGETGNGVIATTEKYDGTSWTLGGDLNTIRESLAVCGTQSAGLALGGDNQVGGSTNYLASTEEYDGTSWSAGGDLNTGRTELGSCGIQSAAVSCGGKDSSGYLDTVEEYS